MRRVRRPNDKLTKTIRSNAVHGEIQFLRRVFRCRDRSRACIDTASTSSVASLVCSLCQGSPPLECYNALCTWVVEIFCCCASKPFIKPEPGRPQKSKQHAYMSYKLYQIDAVCAWFHSHAQRLSLMKGRYAQICSLLTPNYAYLITCNHCS